MVYTNFASFSGDLRENLTFMFREDDWKKKMLIGGVVSLIPFLNFIGAGYAVAVIENIRADLRPTLPTWGDNFGKFFIDGLLLAVFGFIYYIPMFVLSLVVQGIAGAVQYSSYSSSGSFSSGASSVASIATLLLGLVTFVYAVGLIFWMQGVTVNYAMNRTFASAFALDHILQIVLKNWGRMLLTVLIYVVGLPLLYLVCALLFFIPCVGWIGLWLVLAGGIFYFLLVFAYNCGFIARKAGPGLAPVRAAQPSTPPSSPTNLGGWG